MKKHLSIKHKIFYSRKTLWTILMFLTSTSITSIYLIILSKLGQTIQLSEVLKVYFDFLVYLTGIFVSGNVASKGINIIGEILKKR